MSSDDAEHEREMLQLIEGAPQPGISIAEIGRAIGVSEKQARVLADNLEKAGKLRWEDGRPIAVRPAAGD